MEGAERELKALANNNGGRAEGGTFPLVMRPPEERRDTARRGAQTLTDILPRPTLLRGNDPGGKVTAPESSHNKGDRFDPGAFRANTSLPSVGPSPVLNPGVPL